MSDGMPHGEPDPPKKMYCEPPTIPLFTIRKGPGPL
jgi:hypothetical protein